MKLLRIGLAISAGLLARRAIQVRRENEARREARAERSNATTPSTPHWTAPRSTPAISGHAFQDDRDVVGTSDVPFEIAAGTEAHR